MDTIKTIQTIIQALRESAATAGQSAERASSLGLKFARQGQYQEAAQCVQLALSYNAQQIAMTEESLKLSRAVREAWMRSQLEMRQQYEKGIAALEAAGQLGWTNGVSPLAGKRQAIDDNWYSVEGLKILLHTQHNPIKK